MILRTGMAVFAAATLASVGLAQTSGSTGTSSPTNSGAGTVATSADDAAKAQSRAEMPLAPVLTEKEQATLAKCKKMDPIQQGQSSKCSAVLTKSGAKDPAMDRGPGPSH